MLPKERKVVGWLSERGFPVTFRATRSNEALHTSDLLIGTTRWEIKQPKGNGKQTIFHQFEEAALQSSRLVLDVSEVISPEAGDRWNLPSVEEEVRKKIRWHYKDENGDQMQFDEVMIITQNHLRKKERKLDPPCIGRRGNFLSS